MEKLDAQVAEATKELEERLANSALSLKERHEISSMWKDFCTMMRSLVTSPLEAIPILIGAELHHLSKEVGRGLIPHLEKHPFIKRVEVQGSWKFWVKHLCLILTVNDELIEQLRNDRAESLKVFNNHPKS